jgi:hypothetical protein
MYAVTSMPFVNLTRATLRNAELGFLGVVVYTLVHTPLFCGLFFNAGAVDFLSATYLPCLTNWLIVGMLCTSFLNIKTISIF